MSYLSYIKLGVIIISVAAIVWFYKDWEHKSNEIERIEENNRQKEIVDSLKIAFYVYDKKQMEKYAKENANFYSILKENNIKLNRVTSVMNHLLKYRDTTIVQTDLSEVLTAVKAKKDISIPIKDSTKCLVIKGKVELIGGVMTLNITDRIFTGNTTAIGYWERREWRFLGIKTRFLGKKQITAKVIDKCGGSQIINIEKKE